MKCLDYLVYKPHFLRNCPAAFQSGPTILKFPSALYEFQLHHPVWGSLSFFNIYVFCQIWIFFFFFGHYVFRFLLLGILSFLGSQCHVSCALGVLMQSHRFLRLFFPGLCAFTLVLRDRHWSVFWVTGGFLCQHRSALSQSREM